MRKDTRLAVLIVLTGVSGIVLAVAIAMLVLI